MKYRYIFTVIREFSSKDKEEQAQDFFGAIQDETGEFLYGGSGDREKIGAELQVYKNGYWISLDKFEPKG